MKSLLAAIQGCLSGTCHRSTLHTSSDVEEKKHLEPMSSYRRYETIPAYTDKDIDIAAAKFMSCLEKGHKLDQKVKNDLLYATGYAPWTTRLAKVVLDKLVSTVSDVMLGKIIPAGALQEAIDKAVDEAIEFAEEHPVYFTLIALGVLVLVAPWVLEVLGFAEEGPVAGSFAAMWQSLYGGYVPIGSLFAYLQRLGMTLHR